MDILILSKRMFIDDQLIDGGVLVSQEGKITKILRGCGEVNSYMYTSQADEILDFSDYVMMPGLIDSHVHINEPGRKDWEGFVTATKAAAAGGFTTIVDMPLNSIPPTTTVANLKTKAICARGKIYVDVAFWGGIVPDNLDELRLLANEGVVGFKCFLCPSGVTEFPHVGRNEVDNALKKLQGTGTVVAFHAELCPEHPIEVDEEQPKKYETYLNSRPASMEIDAIKMITELAAKYRTRTHIVHLSSAESLPMINECRQNGAPLTVETCHHYLSLNSNEIPDARTEFKCSPPIRNEANRENLWHAIVNGKIDMVVSDHSPCTPGLKCLTYGKNRGDFLKAWGGISSLQFGLPLFWTHCQKYGLAIKDVVKLLVTGPAQLCSLDDVKGKIAEGYDADFCIWDPDAEFTVVPDIIQFQNKANPYMNQKLRGVVIATIVRGLHVFEDTNNQKFGQPLGQLILKRITKKVVNFRTQD